ncbi:glycosyltransferase family 52 [Halomonas icarae]|uniref:Glycosyltransferase family 52 n=1 Tax=Halomonas icarae TaxID=2691040 RepID=A0A7X5AL82_9GAMM|nr:glycosyltransferase family 52 [Halomonas icarae]MDR5903022.1 glycosyltransferase family 52 [Halomonas icarae]NAW11579.1 hypothetical protein [Halomonas icarae]
MNHDKKRTLLLVRTPLQAWLADKIIEQVGPLSIDLVYFTYHDSTKDRFYFSLLTPRSRRSLYLNVRRRNREAIHHAYIYLMKFFGRGFCGYDQVLLASFDNYLFRMLARRNRHAKLITFDDGTANIYPHSSYHDYTPSRLTWLYDLIFGAGSKEQFKEDINKHYTIYEGFNNIVEGDKLKVLCPWENDVFGWSGGTPVKFFIGQPFDEVVATGGLHEDDLLQLENLVSEQGIDYYLQHPRETRNLNVGGVLVGDAEKISEEVIAELCGGRKAIVYAWFSTVLFNLPDGRVRKVYLSIGDSYQEKVRSEMCKRAGCEVWRVNSAS